MSSLATTPNPLNPTSAELREGVRFALSEGAALARQGKAGLQVLVYSLTARVLLEVGAATPLRAGLTQALKASEGSAEGPAATALEVALKRFLSA